LWTHNTDSEINSVDFSPDGSRILAAGYEINPTIPAFIGRVYYLDQNGVELWNRTVPVAPGVAEGPRFPSLSAKISLDGTRIFVNEGPRLSVFDTNGQLLWSYSSNNPPNSTSYLFGGSLASADLSFVVMIDDKVHAFNIQGSSVWNSTELPGFITGATISKDGKYLAFVGESPDPRYQNSTLFLFDRSGSLVWTRPLFGASQTLAFAADDSFLVLQSRGTASFDLQNRQLWNYTRGEATSLALPSDRSYAVTGMPYQDQQTIRVLNSHGNLIWGASRTGHCTSNLDLIG